MNQSIYLTPLGHVRHFIETCGTLSPLCGRKFVYFWADLLLLPREPKKQYKRRSNKQAVCLSKGKIIIREEIKLLCWPSNTPLGVYPFISVRWRQHKKQALENLSSIKCWNFCNAIFAHTYLVNRISLIHIFFYNRNAV